jgi:DNA integrity scanning protein DisA with diadenylate cyclase activity
MTVPQMIARIKERGARAETITLPMEQMNALVASYEALEMIVEAVLESFEEEGMTKSATAIRKALKDARGE